MKTRFCDKLRTARKRSGQTQAQLAAKINVKPQAVTQYEKGVSTPSLERLVQLEKIFGVTDGELILSSDRAPLALEVARILRDKVADAN